jgi:hypothetical protein
MVRRPDAFSGADLKAKASKVIQKDPQVFDSPGEKENYGI